MKKAYLADSRSIVWSRWKGNWSYRYKMSHALIVLLNQSKMNVTVAQISYLINVSFFYWVLKSSAELSAELLMETYLHVFAEICILLLRDNC